MKSKKHILRIVLFALLVLACVVGAVVCGVETTAAVAIILLMQAPFFLVGLPMYIFSDTFLPVVFIVPAIAFLAALVYPVVLMIKRRKFSRRFFLWLIFAVFVVIDLFCAPSEVSFIFALLAYLMLLLCVLCECNYSLKEDGTKSYKYILIILYLMIIFSTVGICFAELANTVMQFRFSELGVAVYATLKYLVNVGSYIITMLALFRAIKAIRLLRVDMYDKNVIGVLGQVGKLCKVGVVYTIVSTMCLIVAAALTAFLGGTITFNFDFSLISLLTICIIVVFAGMLKRSIAEHEENELTI